jgi:hypothetical protein
VLVTRQPPSWSITIMKTAAWSGFLLVVSTPMALAQGSTSKSTSYSFSTTRTASTTNTRSTTRTSTTTSTPKPSAGAPLYKNPNASIEDRVKDLLPRMTLEEKVAQLIQGDINGWMNMTDPADNTLTSDCSPFTHLFKLMVFL